MNERTERIYEALNSLGAALDLNGESGTESLFLILCAVFNDANYGEMEDIRQESHGEGLMHDMNALLAEKIADVADEQLTSEIPP